jgi:CRISPR-associated protein Csm3
MRIGGAEGNMEIGSTVDPNLAVLLHPITGYPYLPGSSLKGKVRSLIEKVDGAYEKNPPHRLITTGLPCCCGRITCRVCQLFGAHNNVGAASGPTRIRVRDAYLGRDSEEDFDRRKREVGVLLEHKTENMANRNGGTASGSLRTGERVPPGTGFDAEIILQIFDVDSNRREVFLRTIAQGLGLLADADSLGASGSRGYGAVSIPKVTQISKKVADIEIPFDIAAV